MEAPRLIGGKRLAKLARIAHTAAAGDDEVTAALERLARAAAAKAHVALEQNDIALAAGDAREKLQRQIEKLATERPPVPQRSWRKPQWVSPELRERVRHLAGGDTLRHARVLGVFT